MIQRTFALLICIGVAAVAQDVQLKVTIGIPFTAQATTETTRTLAVGNHILTKRTASIARDSDGRTRREQKLEAGSVVFLQDPVAGVNYVLESRSHTARKLPSTIPAKAAGVEGSIPKPEPLGTQLTEGLQADGTRLTRTIPSGTAGNELPLEIATETWFSPELQVIVMNISRDPRVGETTYKLTNIQRTEPDRSLFEIPSDYTIVETPESRSMEKSKSQ